MASSSSSQTPYDSSPGSRGKDQVRNQAMSPPSQGNVLSFVGNAGVGSLDPHGTQEEPRVTRGGSPDSPECRATESCTDVLRDRHTVLALQSTLHPFCPRGHLPPSVPVSPVARTRVGLSFKELERSAESRRDLFCALNTSCETEMWFRREYLQPKNTKLKGR